MRCLCRFLITLVQVQRSRCKDDEALLQERWSRGGAEALVQVQGEGQKGNGAEG